MIAPFDRIRGAILAALAGDALGVPVADLGRGEFPEVTGMRGGGASGMPPGTWSQHGSLILCTIESLVERASFDESDLGDRFLRWLFNRHWAARRITFGAGFTTREAIVKIREGASPAKAGLDGEDDNGCGSLVRTLPVAIFAHMRRASTQDAVALAHRASRITHAHPRAQLCCGLLCLFQMALLEGKAPAEALATMREKAAEVYASDPWNGEYRPVQGIMERDFTLLDREQVSSTGYSVHTFEAALWCFLRGKDLRSTVLEAVNLGFDSDSTGAVAGALAGLHYGPAAIPPDWLEALARLDEIEALTKRFAALGG